MANGDIVLDIGGAISRGDMAAFFRDAGLVHSALDSMRDSARGFGEAVARAARGFARVQDAARGALSALMHTANVAQGLEAGVMNLYRWSREWWKTFSGGLDRLATSALYLKNSLAAMAAPLINAVAPAIDLVTDRLVELFNLVNQVFARLTGAKTYVAAKKTADAWDSVKGRISRATSALKRYIAGFDQLNVLTDGSAGSGSSAGGAGGGVAAMFETREINDGLAGFVDSLKAAFEASDWATLGALLGGKINELVDGVDWAALGSKFGFYLNGAVQTAYSLLDTVNFENIGARIAEFLNHALSEIDFSTVGATVALFFASLAQTLAGFVDNFDWEQFAGKLAEGVNGFAGELGARLDAVDWAALALKLTEGLNTFIAGTDWTLVGQTLAGRINDLLAILGTASASFDWKAAGAALAEAVNSLFRGIDWDGLGQWLNDALLGVLDFGLAFFEGFDAAGFADGVGRALAKVDWSAVAEKLWALFSAALSKLGEAVGTLLFGGNVDLGLNLSLLKDGWSTITAWLGIDSPLLTLIGLKKDGWNSISGFVGTAVTVLAKLKRDGWSSIGAFVGTVVTVLTKLKRDGWSNIEKFVGTAVTVLTKLKKKGWSSIGKYVGTAVTVLTKLKKKGWSSIGGFVGTATTVAVHIAKAWTKGKSALQYLNLSGLSTTVKVFIEKAGSVWDKVKDFLKPLGINLATGGVVTNAGTVMRFAAGGVVNSAGMGRYLSSVPHYAGGTTRAHGTVFVAGEAGPEIMGHINGRTEILNKSQIAQAIYSAVVAGMGQAVNALGLYLGNQLATCTNAVVGTVGNLAAAAGISYHAPAMASGAVLPYEVAAQIAKSSADLQSTLDANNEDLIQTIISVAGQIVAAVQASGRDRRQDSGAGYMSTQQIINQLNQRAQMFGRSPLMD